MHRALPWTMLALAPGSHARSGRRLSPREKSAECCPCAPAAGQPDKGGGVMTMTVVQTVFVTQAQASVAVAQSNGAPSSTPRDADHVVVTVSPRPQPTWQAGPPTDTVIRGDHPPHPATQTIRPADPKAPSGPETVTVEVDAPGQLVPVVTVTQTQDQPIPEALWSPSVGAVTAEAEAPSPVFALHPNLEPPAAKYVPPAQPERPSTVTITVQPSPPAAQPAPVRDHYSTLTETVAGAGAGGDNIDIIIINIYTGETSCRKKHSGKRCHVGSHHRYHRPSAATGSFGLPRPRVSVSASASASLAAVSNNTAIVTLPPGNGTGAAQPTSSHKGSIPPSMGRKPRGPVSLRNW
ncbi:hypothetical protein E4U41_002323 [Claviceps citrina]|nr:hypothetical protein E4U41_002323 [Claviceps citrina]